MQPPQTRIHNCSFPFKPFMKKKKKSSVRVCRSLIYWIYRTKRKKNNSLLWLIFMFGKLFSLALGSKSWNIHICYEMVWSFGTRDIHLSVSPAAPGRPRSCGHGTQQVLYWGTIDMSWQNTKKSFKAHLVADFQWDFITIGLFWWKICILRK